jgi:hypothetical protein
MNFKCHVKWIVWMIAALIFANCNSSVNSTNQKIAEQTDQRIIGQLYAQNGVEIRFGGEQDIQYSGYISLPNDTASGACIIIPPFDSVSVALSKPTQDLIKFFNRQGVATFVYDRPGVGASKGGYEHTSFDDECANMLRVYDEIIKYREIDRSKIGIYIGGFNVASASWAAAKLENMALVISKNAFYNNYFVAMQANLEREVSPADMELFTALFKAAQQPEKEFYFKKCADVLGNHKSGFFFPVVADDPYWDLLLAYNGFEHYSYTIAAPGRHVHFCSTEGGQLDLANSLLSNVELKENYLVLPCGNEMGITPDEMDIISNELKTLNIGQSNIDQELKKE